MQSSLLTWCVGHVLHICPIGCQVGVEAKESGLLSSLCGRLGAGRFWDFCRGGVRLSLILPREEVHHGINSICGYRFLGVVKIEAAGASARPRS